MKLKSITIGLLVCLLFSATAIAQVTGGTGVPSLFYSKTFTAATSDTTKNLKGSGIYNHRLIWSGAGTRTTCGVKLEQSVNGSTWTDLIAEQDCTVNDSATAAGYVNFIRITITAITGSGNVVYAAYDGTGYSSGGSAVSATQSGAWSTRTQDGSGNAITSTTGALDINIKSGITQDVAEGSTAGTYPALVGAIAQTVEKAAGDTGDSVRLAAALDGKLITWSAAAPGDFWQYSGEVTGTSWTAIRAPAANYYQCVTAAYVQNSDASVSTIFTVYDDDDGDVDSSSVLWSGYAAALGGGGRMGEGTSPVFCTTTVNHGLYFVATTTSSECHVTVRGFRTKILPVIAP